MAIESFEFENDSGRDAVGLRLHWSSTRSRVGDPLSVRGAEGPLAAKAGSSRPGVIDIDFSTNPVPKGGRIKVALPVDGEALNGTKPEWLQSGYSDPMEAGDAWRRQLYELLRLPYSTKRSAEPSTTRGLRQMLHRCHLILEMQDPMRGQQEFFYSLDLETHPLLKDLWSVGGKEADLRQEATRSLEAVLRARVIRRSKWHKIPAISRRSHKDGTDFAGQRAEQEHVLAISALMLALIDQSRYFKQFPSTKGRAYQLGLAIEAFANGKLRLDGTTPSHGQPDSANVFCFAELALLCIERGVETERWAELLPGLVRAQAIYTAAYGLPDGQPARYDDYGRWAKEPRQPLDPVRIAQIRGQYRGLTVDELVDEAGRNCRRAFIPED